MQITPLLWQQAHWQLLCTYLTQGRMPQALLISGHTGIGKQLLAQLWASSVLCDQPSRHFLPCGHCHACLLIDAGSHPDWIRIGLEGDAKVIGIDQIRQLITRLQLKPQFERQRVVFINPAHKLNTSASNAFLKYLEEPTERTTLLLMSDRSCDIPATIKSRCQHLHLPLPDTTLSQQWLIAQGVEPTKANTLLALAQGAPLLALDYEQSNWLEQRNRCVNDFIALTQGQQHAVNIAHNWHTLPTRPLLYCLQSWLIDLTSVLLDSPKLTLRYNPDLIKPLSALRHRLNPVIVHRFYQQSLEHAKLLDSTINSQLFWESLLIEWQQLVNASKSSR